jgi:hypothetical protein
VAGGESDAGRGVAGQCLLWVDTVEKVLVIFGEQ